MIREYTITIPYVWVEIYEDPKCPWYWRGSGCYDIEVEHPAKVEAVLYANDLEEAKKMVAEYDWKRDYYNSCETGDVFEIDTDAAEYEETDIDPDWDRGPCWGDIEWEA